jgi:hypothetical protein
VYRGLPEESSVNILGGVVSLFHSFVAMHPFLHHDWLGLLVESLSLRSVYVLASASRDLWRILVAERPPTIERAVERVKHEIRGDIYRSFVCRLTHITVRVPQWIRRYNSMLQFTGDSLGLALSAVDDLEVLNEGKVAHRYLGDIDTASVFVETDPVRYCFSLFKEGRLVIHSYTDPPNGRDVMWDLLGRGALAVSHMGGDSTQLAFWGAAYTANGDLATPSTICRLDRDAWKNLFSETDLLLYSIHNPK